MPVSIRSRLLALVLLLLIPAVLGGGWLVLRSHQDSAAAVQRNLGDTTRALAQAVDATLAERAAIARVLAASPELVSSGPALSPERASAFSTQAESAMRGLRGWVEVSAGGAPVLSTRALGASTTGGVAVPTAPSSEPGGSAVPLDPAPRATIGSLETAADGAPLHASAVHPVERAGRPALLDVSVTIVAEELQRLLDAQKLPPGWTAAVLDAEGTVVARYPDGLVYAGRPATADLRQKMAGKTEGLVRTVTLDGTPVLSSFNTSSHGWSLVAGVPVPAIGGLVPTALVPLLLGGLALLALAVAAAISVSRSIASPVTALKHAAARMQAGDLVAYARSGCLECNDVSAALAEASEAMRHARSDLERQVSEAVARTREGEQRISHSQRVEALGRLTGGVAHDFNNLLGIISNSMHLVQRYADQPELKVPIAATLRAVESGSRLTGHLSRVAGRQAVRPQSVQLQHWLPEVQELLKTVLGKRVEVSAWVAGDTAPLTVDAGELELSLINLALNARDALPAGGQVWLKARNAGADDAAALPNNARYVLISMGDNGSGIDDRLAERVFEPFFTTKDVGKGTGLGLSQVHGFCVQAGGTARISSTPGLGTTVSMVLPASVPSGSTGPNQPALDASVEDGAGLATRRLLLVEDNEELGDVTAALLASYGCVVHRVRGAQEALDVLAAGNRFDVVLSDVVMPGGMDGVTLARELRTREPGLPVVLISGYSSALTSPREFPVLHKPCTPAELVSALQTAIDTAV